MKTTATPAAVSPVRRIAFFEKHYTLIADRLLDACGEPPTEMIHALICRHFVAAPATTSHDQKWCSFRELREAGPLAVNFANNTHKTIAMTFGDDLAALDRAAAGLAGCLEPGQGFDRRYRFQALPDVPLILNYNAPDDLFSAQANLLFRRCAQTRLNIRDLFTLGTYLTGRLVVGTGKGRQCAT